ncbi:flavodoxin family protein [Christensenellaceae bacterium OttesenSCG-928-K19]|nr:flavodoxin family protein [Christensenellaceae bacterium OttesenSCG-928-K19]
MKKAIIVNGSPRKDGYSSRLLDAMAEGAKEQGAEVVVFDLNDTGFRGCQSCFYCRANEGCSTRDYLHPFYEEIKDADAVFFASPIYFYQITGQSKLWLDRMYPMIDNTFKPRYPGKKVVSVFVQGADDKGKNQNVIDDMHKLFIGFGWQVEDSFLICGTSDPNYELPDGLLQQARRAGEKIFEG